MEALLYLFWFFGTSASILPCILAGPAKLQDFQDIQQSKTHLLMSEKVEYSDHLSKWDFRFKNNLELEASLKKIAKQYQNLTRLHSIGRSVLGSPLWVLEISDKPGETEAEPAFKYVGNLHGDEPVGRELLLLLATWLCDNYMKNPLATLIVRDVHLHLLPSMNPDGFLRRSRNNANNVDLNRDFPDQFFPQNNDENQRQPETLAVMNWTRNTRFVASASLHGGALVANYPWDGTADGSTKYSKCDDDSTFQYLAKIYSHLHVNMSSSKEFLGGITNGAAWYPLYGGMQDWNYIYGKCMDLTLEISESKWPAISELEEIWVKNRWSMLSLVASLVKFGVHGKVITDDGHPLAASISVKGSNLTISASKEFGDYHRLLSPGNDYEVTASMAGYRSKTLTVSLKRESIRHLNFVLQPVEDGKDNTTGEDSKAQSAMQYDNEEEGAEQDMKISWVNDNILNSVLLSRERLMTAYEGDIITDLVARHLKVSSICLMLGVLVLFILFVMRCRGLSKHQKTRQSNKH